MATTNTFDYNAGTMSGTSWTNGSNAWDSSDGTYATREIAKNTAFETNEWIKGTANTSSGILTYISKVEIGVEAKASTANNCQLRLVPMFNGSSDGDNHDTAEFGTSDTTTWFDITSDTNAPSTWTASGVENLDVRMFGDNNSSTDARTISIDQIYVRVASAAWQNEPETKQLHYYKSTITNTLDNDNFNDGSIAAFWDIDLGNTLEEGGVMKMWADGHGDSSYLMQTVSGDFDVTVKVVTYSGSEQAGTDEINVLLYCETASAEFYIGVKWDNSWGEWRMFYAGGGTSGNYTAHSTPFWLRLKRIGTIGYLYSSTNGTDWLQQDTGTVQTGGDVGLDTTSFGDASSHVGGHFDDFVSNDVVTGGTTDINIYPLASGVDNYMNVCISGTTVYYIPVVSGAGTGTYPTDLRTREDGYTCTVQSERD